MFCFCIGAWLGSGIRSAWCGGGNAPGGEVGFYARRGTMPGGLLHHFYCL